MSKKKETCGCCAEKNKALETAVTPSPEERERAVADVFMKVAEPIVKKIVEAIIAKFTTELESRAAELLAKYKTCGGASGKERDRILSTSGILGEVAKCVKKSGNG